MTERIPCKEPECTNTILPSTGESTGGICMPCHGRKKKAAHEEYVRKNRRVVDPFDCVSDPVEIIKIFHRPRKYDPLIQLKPLNRPLEDVYASLSATDANRLTSYVDEQIRSDAKESKEIAESIAQDLIVYTQFGMLDVLRSFVGADAYYPGLIFARADASIRDELLYRIASTKADVLRTNHLLCALAWIGDFKVVQQFAAWRAKPPEWEKLLCIPAHGYSIVGGWELDAQNKRRDLFYPECHALTLANENECTAIQFSAKSSSRCPWCDAHVSELLSIDTTKLALSYLGWPLPALKVAACPDCFWYGTMYTKVDADGSVAIHPKTPRPENEPGGHAEPLPMKHLALSPESRSALRGARVWDTHGSQIGGHPAWVQDSVYPTCLDCGKSMKNFGQVVHDEVEPHTEGTFYFYLCADCSVTAVEYQQT